MTLFEERERGYEAKWAHDEELQFRVMARRSIILGEWAAALLNLSPAQTADYAKIVVAAGMSGKGKDPLFEKLRSDLWPTLASDHQIIAKMKEAFELASAKGAAS